MGIGSNIDEFTPGRFSSVLEIDGMPSGFPLGVCISEFLDLAKSSIIENSSLKFPVPLFAFSASRKPDFRPKNVQHQ